MLVTILLGCAGMVDSPGIVTVHPYDNGIHGSDALTIFCGSIESVKPAECYCNYPKDAAAYMVKAYADECALCTAAHQSGRYQSQIRTTTEHYLISESVPDVVAACAQ